jgi:pimeloyl-ACP methyl ester carboxylesterase
MMPQVILAHGLWVPGLVMQPLAARLERAGFRCRTFDYMGRARPLAAHAERLARLARSIGPAHFVAHSLGGLVVLEALESDRALEAGRVVLLGTPARGCLSGRRLEQHALGRWLLGKSERLWRDGREAQWTRPEALGVVAGTVALGLGRLFGRLPGQNDGVVTLEETTVAGMRDRVALPVGHSQMLFSARVARQIEAFLRDGRFAPHDR